MTLKEMFKAKAEEIAHPHDGGSFCGLGCESLDHCACGRDGAVLKIAECLEMAFEAGFEYHDNGVQTAEECLKDEFDRISEIKQ